MKGGANSLSSDYTFEQKVVDFFVEGFCEDDNDYGDVLIMVTVCAIV